MDYGSLIGDILTSATQTVVAGVNLGATINTNQTNAAIVAAQNAAVTQQNKDNNATAIALAQQAQQQQQNLLNYEMNSQRLGQQGVIHWVELLGIALFVGLLALVGYKAFGK